MNLDLKAIPDKLPICVETFITAINHDIKSSKTKKTSPWQPNQI